MELSTLFRITGQKIINEYKKSKEAGLNHQNTETQIQVILDGLAKDYKELQEKYQEKTRKTAIKQIKQIKEKQKKKQLGQERPGHEKTAYKFINTLLQTKIKPKLEKIYKIKPNKKVKKEIRENKQDLSKTILSKPVKKPKNATNTLLQTKIENRTELVTQRINKEIKEILKTSETEGIGTKQVAEKLQKKFNQLKGYEAERIARTEINSANNKVAFEEIFNDETVQYKQWITCDDNRVRTTHIELDEQITRVGDKFSNGLQYPGDHQGKASEVINCRCTLIPYFLDWNKIPPNDATYFYEKDLIEFDADYDKQVELQYDENIKLFEAKQGYIEANKEFEATISPIQKIVEKIKKPIATIENKTHNTTTKIQQVFNKTEKTIQNTTKQVKNKNKYLQKTAQKHKKNNKKLIQENPKIQKNNLAEYDYIKLEKYENELYAETLECFTDKIKKELDKLIMEKNNFTQEIFNNLPKEIYEGCLGYVGKDYKYIRTYLNTKTRNNLELEQINKVEKILKGILSVVREIKDNMIVYRGDSNIYIYDMTKRIDKLKDLKEGKLYSFDSNSFISTSINRKAPIELKYAKRIMYKIYVPKGTRMVPLLGNSFKPEEAEIILMPGQRFELVKIKETKNMIYITIKLINSKK
nr:phage minor head protein [Methanosphaera cuniculi]